MSEVFGRSIILEFSKPVSVVVTLDSSGTNFYSSHPYML